MDNRVQNLVIHDSQNTDERNTKTILQVKVHNHDFCSLLKAANRTYSTADTSIVTRIIRRARTLRLLRQR